MTVARKETPIGNRACVRLCVRVFVEGHVYREPAATATAVAVGIATAVTPSAYIVSAYCWLVHIFVVATYKSSAFPLTSHYRT